MLNHTTAILIFLLSLGSAIAAEVNLNGIVGERALVIVDGGKARWLTVGATSPEGLKLVRVEGQSAVIEMNGKRETLTLGQSARLSGGGSARSSGVQSTTLIADGQGHFIVTGAINGMTVRFLVDTGASLISMSTSDARRLGIIYTTGQRATAATANGMVSAYRVKLDEVRVGEVRLTNVDCIVHAGEGPPVILLGMSFLNRMEMRRDGEKMTLTKRY